MRIGAPQCFVAGTLVLAASGLVPIEDVAVGDQVWAWDETTGYTGLYEVVQLMRPETDELIKVSIGEEVIEATPEHPFYVVGVGWVEAEDLKPGDTLRTFDGRAPPEQTGSGSDRLGDTLRVDAVERVAVSVPVYNFEVAGAHTYFVTAAAVLVHNDCAKLSSRAARRQAMREQGIPTSQQPISQSRNAAGREYRYEVPEKGGGKQIKSVQQQTLDRNHPGQGHWEAGRVKTYERTGEIRYNRYDRPQLTNDKSKVSYDD